MGIFDAIKHSFNPEVRETYDDLIKNYRKGLEAFCLTTGGSYGSFQFRRIVLSDSMSYSDMKIIYDSRDDIKKLHKRIIETEKIDDDYNELETLQRLYPHAFISICHECLNGIIYNSNIEMPGSKGKSISKTYSPLIGTTIVGEGKYYGGQYNPIGCDLWGNYSSICSMLNSSFNYKKYESEPKCVRDLIYTDVQKLLQYKSIFRKREADILLALEDEKNKALLCVEKDKIHKIEEQRKEAERVAELERLREEERIKKSLPSKTSSWGNSVGGLRYDYLLKYYPTTCDFEASQSEWDDRWTVWNFKNTPGKTSPAKHGQALDLVIPRLKTKLNSTFGQSSLKYLTLVCIPASSAAKTQARYKEFSQRLCKETGMINAYDHMDVVSSSEEKKFGGSGVSTDNVSFDSSFFRGKYIILFDDVITKGDSMLRFKRKMESLGATVVGGLSIGKTTHSR